MKKILLTLAFTIVLIAGCSKSKTENTIIMGTSATFPPFEYLGGSDGKQVIGFDVALAEQIAKQLGKTLKIEDMDFDALLPALSSGKVDFVIAGMTITDERKQNVDFSIPYYEAAQTVLIKKGDKTFDDIKTKEDLGNKKSMATQLGTTGDAIANEISKNVTAFKSFELAVMELKNGRVDAVIVDTEPAKAFMSKNTDITVFPVDFDKEYYGVAMKKGNAELLASINSTIEKIKTSGDYNVMLEKYIQKYSAE